MRVIRIHSPPSEDDTVAWFFEITPLRRTDDEQRLRSDLVLAGLPG